MDQKQSLPAGNAAPFRIAALRWAQVLLLLLLACVGFLQFAYFDVHTSNAPSLVSLTRAGAYCGEVADCSNGTTVCEGMCDPPDVCMRDRLGDCVCLTPCHKTDAGTCEGSCGDVNKVCRKKIDASEVPGRTSISCSCVPVCGPTCDDCPAGQVCKSRREKRPETTADSSEVYYRCESPGNADGCGSNGSGQFVCGTNFTGEVVNCACDELCSEETAYAECPTPPCPLLGKYYFCNAISSGAGCDVSSRPCPSADVMCCTTGKVCKSRLMENNGVCETLFICDYADPAPQCA